MHPLPEPETGASIESLRRFINVKLDDDFWLLAGWLLGALREGDPYPVFVLSGEQESSKSTVSRCLKELGDPHTVMLRNLLREFMRHYVRQQREGAQLDIFEADKNSVEGLTR